MMAECFRCGEDPNTSTGCVSTRTITFADGQERHPVPVGEERWTDDPSTCRDCHAEVGNVHHPGCAIEACPRCGHHYTRCACDTKEKRWLDGNRKIEF